MAITGSLTAIIIFVIIFSVCTVNFTIVPAAIKITGKKAVNILVNIPGNSLSGISFPAKVANGWQLIFFRDIANIGPAIIMAGTATIKPYNKVMPRSAWYCVTNAVGDG